MAIVLYYTCMILFGLYFCFQPPGMPQAGEDFILIRTPFRLVPDYTVHLKRTTKMMKLSFPRHLEIALHPCRHVRIKFLFGNVLGKSCGGLVMNLTPSTWMWVWIVIWCSLSPSAWWHQIRRSTLVQVMTWLLFSAKPLPVQMLTYCQMHP